MTAAYLPLLLRAAGTTIWLSWLAMLLGVVGGVALALLRTSPYRALRLPALVYTEFFRSIPILIVMFFCYFGVPLFLGQDLSPFAAATLALALHASASMAEVVRAGIESVGHGQSEAARALGLHRLQAFRLVVLPQALRAVLPPLGSQFILLMLNSSVVSVISAEELTAAAQDIQSRTFRSFEAYIVATGIYFCLSVLFSGVFAAVERAAFARPATR